MWLEEHACLNWKSVAVAIDKEEHQDEAAALQVGALWRL